MDGQRHCLRKADCRVRDDSNSHCLTAGEMFKETLQLLQMQVRSAWCTYSMRKSWGFGKYVAMWQIDPSTYSNFTFVRQMDLRIYLPLKVRNGLGPFLKRPHDLAPLGVCSDTSRHSECGYWRGCTLPTDTALHKHRDFADWMQPPQISLHTTATALPTTAKDCFQLPPLLI